MSEINDYLRSYTALPPDSEFDILPKLPDERPRRRFPWRWAILLLAGYLVGSVWGVRIKAPVPLPASPEFVTGLAGYVATTPKGWTIDHQYGRTHWFYHSGSFDESRATTALSWLKQNTAQIVRTWCWGTNAELWIEVRDENDWFDIEGKVNTTLEAIAKP